MDPGYAEMARLMGLEPVTLEDFWKKVAWLGWRSMADGRGCTCCWHKVIDSLGVCHDCHNLKRMASSRCHNVLG